MSFTQYILFILQKSGRSLQAALNTFFQAMGEEPGSYSKQAFSKGRLYIRPEAILELFRLSVQNFYAEAEFQTFCGYRVLAIDGTRLNLPNVKELKEEFGVQTSQGTPQVQALASGLYDVQNKIMVDVRIAGCHANERDHAAELIAGLKEQPELKNLILLDRGYPSAQLLHQIQNDGHAYVARCCSEFVKGMKLHGDDCIIEYRFSKARKHPLKIRVVKVRFPDGKVEILVTNLFSSEITLEKLGQIYKMRWGIETNYNNIKNKLCVENFSGISRIVVLQDFYATMLLWNLTGILAFDLREDIESKHRSESNKNQYQLNMSMTIATLKENVVRLVMCNSRRQSQRILRQIHKALYRSVVMSKPNRSFPRKRKHITLKFHNNAKPL